MNVNPKLSNLALAVALCACATDRDRSVGDSPEPKPVHIDPGAFARVWAYSAGSANGDWGQAVAVHPGGDLLVLGFVRGDARLGDTTIETSPDDGGSLLARLSAADGTVVWARTLGNLWVHAIDVADTGELVAVARSRGGDSIDGLAFPGDSNLLLAISPDGVVTRATVVTPDAFAQHVSVSPSGDVFVAGSWLGPAEGAVSVDASPPAGATVSHGFVARLTRDGVLVWRKEFATAANDEVTAIEATGTGVVVAGVFGASELASPSLVVDGHTFDNPGRGGAFVASLAADGSMQWGHGFGSPDVEHVHDVALGDDGAVYVAGVVRGTAALPTGNVTATSPNGDGFVLELAADGEPRSHTLVRAPVGAIVTSATAGPDGLYLAGTCDGDYVRVGAAQVPAGTHDMFVARLAAGGDVPWLHVFAGQEPGAHENARDIAVVGPSRVVLTGDFSGLDQPARLDLGDEILEGRGDSDLFVGVLELE